MRFCILTAILFCAAQAAPGGKFAGTWQAKFKDVVICTIEIREGETLSGESKSCKISVDQNGDLIDGETPDESQAPEPFLSPKIDGDSLRYEQEDGTERMKFEFRLTGAGKAELRLVGAPVAVKPIRFERRS